MDLEAALTWKTCTVGFTEKLSYGEFHFKKIIELCCDLWKLFLFQMNKDNTENSIDLILVGKCPLPVISL